MYIKCLAVSVGHFFICGGGRIIRFFTPCNAAGNTGNILGFIARQVCYRLGRQCVTKQHFIPLFLQKMFKKIPLLCTSRNSKRMYNIVCLKVNN